LRDYQLAAFYIDWHPIAGTYTVMVYARELGSKSATYDLRKTWTVMVAP
jgi:hypothetical protein